MDHTWKIFHIYNTKNGSHLEEWVTLWKMCHCWKNRWHLKKWVTRKKNGSHLEKWVTLGKIVTLGKMGNTRENGSKFWNTWKVKSLTVKIKFIHSIKRMCHTSKNGSHYEKWVTLGIMEHSWKNGSHWEKYVTLGKMGRTWENGSYLEKMDHTWENGSHLRKWVPLGKVCHTWNNMLIFEKWVTLERMNHS